MSEIGLDSLRNGVVEQGPPQYRPVNRRGHGVFQPPKEASRDRCRPTEGT